MSSAAIVISALRVNITSGIGQCFSIFRKIKKKKSMLQRQDEEETMLIEMDKDTTLAATNVGDDMMVMGLSLLFKTPL